LLSVRFPRDRKAVPHRSFQGAVNKPLRVEYRGPIGHAVHPIKPFTQPPMICFIWSVLYSFAHLGEDEPTPLIIAVALWCLSKIFLVFL